MTNFKWQWWMSGKTVRKAVVSLPVLFFVMIYAPRISAQPTPIQATDGIKSDLEGLLYARGTNFHTAIKPWYNEDLGDLCDSVLNYPLNYPGNSRAAENFFTRHAVVVDGNKFNFHLDPVINLSGGKDLLSKDSWLETGLGLSAGIRSGRNFGAGGNIFYSQSSFPNYVEELIEQWRVMPGSGYAYSSKMGGFNNLDYSFFANYRALKYFTLGAGFGKQFWGDGYRSLFLSDNAWNYPYIKIEANVWKIKYTCLYAALKDMHTSDLTKWGDFANKYGVFHYLSWNIGKRFNVGVFEAVMWQGADSSGNRGFDVSYLNPLIFLRPIEFSLGSPDNSLMGISMSMKIRKRSFLYGQLLLDDMVLGEVRNGSINRFKHWFGSGDSTDLYGYWATKQAWQLGFKSFDLFGLKNLDIQIEANFIRPYTYSHRLVIKNYGHYNESLAHPGGSNLWELSGFLRYNRGRWFAEAHLNYLETGLDSLNSHFGGNIYQSTFDTYYPELDNIVVAQYGNNIGQGIKKTVLYGSVKASYLLNPKSNLRIESGIALRNAVAAGVAVRSLYCWIGITSRINQRYFDFR